MNLSDKIEHITDYKYAKKGFKFATLKIMGLTKTLPQEKKPHACFHAQFNINTNCKLNFTVHRL